MDGAVPQYGRMCKFIVLPIMFIIVKSNRFANIDRESISSMKRYMLRQIPGHELLLLPPYDTRNYTHHKTMDHLVDNHCKYFSSFKAALFTFYFI